MSALWKQLFFQILLLLISCRCINTKTSGPTPSPAAPISPLQTDVRSVVLKGESHTEKVEELNPVNLTLECIWTGNLNKLPNITGYWRKDGHEIENSRVTVQLENEKYNLKWVVTIVSKENLGNYSCMFGNEAKIDFILAAPQIGEVRDKPIVSYVGDYAVITCKMEETKPKPISWNWYKPNGTDKEQISVAAEPHRYEIKNEEGTTKLVVHNLTQDDSGLYYCEAVYAISTSMSHVELRVITFWEPLKPFLAILVEVIILVAAILIYERSQSKKICTAENGTNADQTNTQMQGENNGSEGGSSMRQRKV
ncbi:embigin [Trachinotus anak]|uniref:embigin n=1 Tax=Trachinotus anak TaxID=443729 RepID=UPI0039F21AB2